MLAGRFSSGGILDPSGWQCCPAHGKTVGKAAGVAPASSNSAQGCFLEEIYKKPSIGSINLCSCSSRLKTDSVSFISGSCPCQDSQSSAAPTPVSCQAPPPDPQARASASMDSRCSGHYAECVAMITRNPHSLLNGLPILWLRKEQ